MDKAPPPRIGRVGETVLYLFGLWISLTVFILAMPWVPVDAFLQSAKIVLMLAAGILLVISLFGAASGLLGAMAWMAPRDPDPKP
jgi:hypothetical protein